MIRAYVAKRYLNLTATIDAQITALFVHWLATGDTIGSNCKANERFAFQI